MVVGVTTRTATSHSRAVGARFAWLASCAVAIALVVLLGAVRSAQAAPLPPAGPSGPGPSLLLPEAGELASEEVEETAEGEVEEEWAECEELEEGGEREACEEEVEEQEELEEIEECTVSEADSTVSADAADDTLRVVVHYRTYAPGRVAVDYQVRGGRGSLTLDPRTSLFGRRGVFHDTRHLSQAQMEKVLAAHQFTVELEPVGAPDQCQGRFDERLSAKRDGRAERIWST